MQIRIKPDMVGKEPRDWQLKSCFNLQLPVTVIGELIPKKVTNRDTHGIHFYLCRQHKGSNSASIPWAIGRVEDQEHTWHPTRPEDTLEHIEMNTETHPVYWLKKTYAVPAANKYAKTALEKYDS